MRRFILLVSFPFILSGCSVGDFLGAYFNTFYNAQKTFNEAEREVLNTGVTVATSRTEKAFLAPFDVPPPTKAKFTTVIEKCSKLLQYHPESKLVDDALLMIGKSYYYQNEYQSAERKFKELLSTHPESDLIYETKLLLANTYYKNNDKPTAAVTAKELLDEAKKEELDGIVAKTAILLAHIEFENRNYAEALGYYRMAAELSETSEERSGAYRAVAEMYMQQEKYKDAADAFIMSGEVSSEYLDAYRGQIGEARMLSRIGRHEESLTLLDNLSRNANYREFLGEVNLEIGNVYRNQNDFPSAEEQYRYVDTAYARTEVASLSHYQLGLLYERERNYDSARVAYEKGKAEFPQAEVTVALVKRSEALNKYILHRTEIVKYDSIRRFLLLPPDTTKTIVAVPDSTKRIVAMTDSTKHDSTKSLAHVDSMEVKVPSVPPLSMDTVQARLAYNQLELASLFYASIGVLDSASYWYKQLLKDYPKSPYAPRALYTLAQIYSQDSTDSRAKVDSLHREIVQRFPDSEFAVESRRYLKIPEPKKRVDPKETSYAIAEALVKRGEVTAALKSLKAIADVDSTSPYAAKAQYAIGWIYENVKPNPDSSIASYQKLLKRFPQSAYASAVQPKLAEVELQKQQKLQEMKKDSVVSPPPPSNSKLGAPIIEDSPKDSVNVPKDSPIPPADNPPKKDEEEKPKP